MDLSCDKKNLKWIFISYGIYETRCVFYIPSPKARGYKTHNSFHKYRIKWKYSEIISDPILIRTRQINWCSLLIFASIAYAQDMHFGYLNLQNIPCIAYCVTNKTTKFWRGSTNENNTFDIETCDIFVSWCIQHHPS